MESFIGLKDVANGQSGERWELGPVYMTGKYSHYGGNKNCCQEYFSHVSGTVILCGRPYLYVRHYIIHMCHDIYYWDFLCINYASKIKEVNMIFIKIKVI